MKKLVLSLGTAALAGTASCTAVWVLWALKTPGDYFANGSALVGPTMVGALIVGLTVGYYARRRWRVAIWLIGALSLAYLIAVPSGWWAKGPM